MFLGQIVFIFGLVCACGGGWGSGGIRNDMLSFIFDFLKYFSVQKHFLENM